MLPSPESELKSARAAAMTQYRRSVAQARSMADRMQIAHGLQRSAMELIKSNPEAYRAFMARNLRKRRQSQVRDLERIMRRGRHA